MANINVSTEYGITVLPKYAKLWINTNKEKGGLCCDGTAYYANNANHDGYLKDWNTARDARWLKGNNHSNTGLAEIGLETANITWANTACLNFHKLWDENSILGLTDANKFKPTLYTTC